MKNIIIVSLFVLATGFTSNAQDYIVDATKNMNNAAPTWMINIDYGMGFGTGDFKEFIESPSYIGFYIDGRKFITSNLSVGGGIGWNAFNKKFNRDTYTFDGGAITGTKWNFAFVLPLFVNAHYYLSQDWLVKPFVGINTGAYYTEYEVEIGSYAYRDKNWNFGLAPEIGFYLPLGESGWAFNVKGRYNHIFYKKNNMGGWQYLGVNIGISFIP